MNRVVAIGLGLALAAANWGAAAQTPRWSIAIHGGAGVIERGAMDRDTEIAYRLALESALNAAAAKLEAGASALDAVEVAIRLMEDDPLFNAGRGAVFTAEGRNELDAAIMDGRSRKAGAVAGVTRVRHPISAARAVMEQSSHVLLSGQRADDFAAEKQLEIVDPSFFFTERRWTSLIEVLAEQGLPIPARPAGAPKKDRAMLFDSERKFGTVGVVVRDAKGDFAAGTSTGGTTAKRWGRIGDSPVIGAGTYAQNGVCAVSATGAGEYFLRAAVASSICARVQFKGESVQAAADAVIADVGGLGGDGGVVVLGPGGEPTWSFNTSGMYRAKLTAGGQPKIAIYEDEG